MSLRLQATQVSWLNTKLTLDFINASRVWIDEDLVSALLVAGVLDANVSGADATAAPQQALFGAGVVPDEMRRPVNAMSIALSLGVPRESARGKLAALVDRGVLCRTGGGLILGADVARSAPFSSAMESFVRATAEFISGLAALEACGARAGDRIATPAWSVAGAATRLVTAHVLRGIDHARSIRPDISLTTHFVLLSLSHLTGSALRVAPDEPKLGPLAPFGASLGPVSVSELARFARMDDETARRHVALLEAAGAVQRVGGKRDVDLSDPQTVARWSDFQGRIAISTQQLVRKFYTAGVMVDAPSDALRRL